MNKPQTTGNNVSKIPEVDVSQIPDYVRNNLLRFFYRAAVEYFKQPGSEEKYQAWLREQEKREKSKGKE